MNAEVKNTVSKTVAVSKTKKSKPKSLDRRKARAGYVFVAPFLIVFLLVYVPIVVESIQYSFSYIVTRNSGGFDLDFVGFDNYSEALFVNPDFVQTLTSGIKQLVIDIPAIVIFSLFMAVVLNQKMVGRAVFRAIFFIPVILSTGIIEQIDVSNAMMESMESTIDTGASSSAAEIISVVDVQSLFANMAVGTELVEYVVEIVNNIYNIVNRSGVQMLIFLAGLQSISPAIYESCTVEGATAWETFWKITFPMISPMILVNTIYTVIDSFTSQSNQVMTFIGTVYEDTKNHSREIATAMSWMYFLIVILIIAAVSALISAYVFYQRKD